MKTVVVPGYTGSGEKHWQTLWERTSPSWQRFAPASWDTPNLDDWNRALDDAVGAGPGLLVCHSLGCLLAARWASRHPDRARGLFLVAPPDPDSTEFPAVAEAFGADMDFPIKAPSVVITSDDDPYCTPERSRWFASVWGASFISMGPRGHLNSASGLGNWPEGRRLLTAFTAGLERS